jgi:hypothetical protein
LEALELSFLANLKQCKLKRILRLRLESEEWNEYVWTFV